MHQDLSVDDIRDERGRSWMESFKEFIKDCEEYFKETDEADDDSDEPTQGVGIL